MILTSIPIGSQVRLINTNSYGIVVYFDYGSYLPYRVRFDDGSVFWYSGGQLTVMHPNPLDIFAEILLK